MLDRALARVHPETSGPIERLDVDLEEPTAAIDTLVAAYPEATSCRCTPPTCSSSWRSAAVRASRSTSSP